MPRSQKNVETYWSHNGSREDLASEYLPLIPVSGKSNDPYIEILRCVCNIYYHVFAGKEFEFGKWKHGLESMITYKPFKKAYVTALQIINFFETESSSINIMEVVEQLLTEVLEAINTTKLSEIVIANPQNKPVVDKLLSLSAENINSVKYHAYKNAALEIAKQTDSVKNIIKTGGKIKFVGNHIQKIISEIIKN